MPTAITTLVGSDAITTANVMTKLNANFDSLNTNKIETSVLDTDTTLAANSDLKVATQKAVKAYVDVLGGVNGSTTVRGVFEEATAAEVLAKTATGGTGSRLVVNPSTLILPPTVQVFTASGTWTKPAGITAVIVELVGGGGGGGGNTTANTASNGGGGGGYSRKRILSAALGATETVTIGAAGAAGLATGGDGGTGGTTLFGTHLQATGGVGGESNSSGGPVNTGGVGSLGNLNVKGQGGGGGANITGIGSGFGGSSLLGGGANSVGGGANAAGQTGGVYGGGGSGATVTGGGADTLGGEGAAGVVIVTEFY